MTDIPISAYIICKNERRVLGKCLDSLEGVHDIVVVDSGSTDGTLDLIRDYQRRGFPLRLFEREWHGYAAQKQFALDQCRHDWRLNLDADERLNDDLRLALAALPLLHAAPALAEMATVSPMQIGVMRIEPTIREPIRATKDSTSRWPRPTRKR